MLLYFVIFVALSQFWYCQNLLTLWGTNFLTKNPACVKHMKFCKAMKSSAYFPLNSRSSGLLEVKKNPSIQNNYFQQQQKHFLPSLAWQMLDSKLQTNKVNKW